MEQAITKGLVLYSQAYKERDRLIRIYTEDFGKCQFFIKNASKSKFAMSLQSFTYAELWVTINESGFSFISDVSQVKPYLNIQKDLFINAHASYIVSLADLLLEDREGDLPLYRFLIQTLELMDQKKDAEILTNIFELQALSRFGAALNLSDCQICSQKNRAMDYSFLYNGCLCQEHFYKDKHRLHIDPNIIYLSGQFLNMSLKKLDKISIKAERKKALRQFIDQLYEEYIGVQPKAKRFLDGMSGWAQLIK